VTLPHPADDLEAGYGLKPPRDLVLSLGANLGDRLETLQRAVDLLAATPGVTLTGVSRVYRTAPVGVVEQPDFYNLVLLARTTMISDLLLERAHTIEGVLGRARTVHWGPRTIDIDLIALGDRVRDDPHLTLPHPRAHERAFVLVPWLDADPDAVLLGHGPVAELVARLDTSGVEVVPDAVVHLP